MIYPDVSVEEWLNRYPTLSPDTEECPVCGHPITLSKPYISADFVGLESEDCKNCGDTGGCRVFVPISKNMLQKSFAIQSSVLFG
jgi:hypothetical protein